MKTKNERQGRLRTKGNRERHCGKKTEDGDSERKKAGCMGQARLKIESVLERRRGRRSKEMTMESKGRETMGEDAGCWTTEGID